MSSGLIFLPCLSIWNLKMSIDKCITFYYCLAFQRSCTGIVFHLTLISSFINFKKCGLHGIIVKCVYDWMSNGSKRIHTNGSISGWVALDSGPCRDLTFAQYHSTSGFISWIMELMGYLSNVRMTQSWEDWPTARWPNEIAIYWGQVEEQVEK